MPTVREIREEVEFETARRARLAVPAFGGGFLYFLSAIVVSSTLSSGPTVGLLQGLEPALRGEANPAVSPRAVEVKYISQHALQLIAGSVVKAISLFALTALLLLLARATRFRRPQSWSGARVVVLVGGIGLGVVNVAHQIIASIRAHNFAEGHDFTNHAVEQTLTKGALNVATQYLDLLFALALVVGMIAVCINAIRVGLVTRWLGVIGVFSAILILLPLGGVTLEIVPAFWMVAIGVLYAERWPNGDLPAWKAGEARPWPTSAERRAERAGAKAGEPAPGAVDGDHRGVSSEGDGDAPEPSDAGGGSRRRRKKRRVSR